MKLENQVVSLELAKKLKELGVKQESYFYWLRTHKGDYAVDVKTELIVMKMRNSYSLPDDFFYSAFTVAELEEMLPEYYYSMKAQGGRWMADVPNGALEDSDEMFIADTEADARAKMLIYLLENKLI